MADRLLALETKLKANLENPDLLFWSQLRDEAGALLADLIADGSDSEANQAWYLRTAVGVYRQYVECFHQIAAGDYYQAWCGLEQAEIALHGLERNPFFDPKLFRLPEMRQRVADWQALYPYRAFFSPAILYKEKHCSICQAQVTPWNDCGHVKGQVYRGQACYHQVTKAEFLEISAVLDPVQKYSVGFAGPNGADHHDYSIARFLVERLASPFDGWRMHWTTAYHPHARFPDATPDGPCPCESGRAYASCCLSEPGVVRPHAQFGFEKEPPNDLPNAAFSGSGDDNGPALMIPHAAAAE